MDMKLKMKRLYFDGACVPVNPGGDMGLGFWIEEDGKQIYSFSKFIDHKTFPTKTSNNIAEYLALKEGLEYCISNGITELQVFGDSKLVIEQMKGNWKMKKGLYLPFAEATKELVGEYTKIDFEWIRRELNTIADALSNRDIPTETKEQAKINFSKPRRRNNWKAAKTKKNWYGG